MVNPVTFFVNHARESCGYDPMPELKKQAAGAVARARKAGKSDEIIQKALARAAETRRFDLWGNFVADVEAKEQEGPGQAWQAVVDLVSRGGKRTELSPRAQAAWIEAFGKVDVRWIETTTQARIRFMQAWKGNLEA